MLQRGGEFEDAVSADVDLGDALFDHQLHAELGVATAGAECCLSALAV